MLQPVPSLETQQTFTVLPSPARTAPYFERPNALTSREHEVLTLVAQGMPNKRVAKHLEISPRTVSTHLTRIYSKLWVESRTAAVVKAARLGWV